MSKHTKVWIEIMIKFLKKLIITQFNKEIKISNIFLNKNLFKKTLALD